MKVIFPKRFYTICVLFTLLLLAGRADAVLLTETQILIGPKQRSGVLTIKNTAKEPLLYRFDAVDMRMLEDGKLEFVEEGSDFPSAKPYIRFAPRRVRMEPGAIQQIRVMVKRTKDMPAGEYRTYLSMKSEALNEATVDNEGGGSVSAASAKLLVGWRLPVIIRHGELSLTPSIENASLSPAGGGFYDLQFDLARTGNMSALGRVDVKCAGSSDSIAQVNIRVYPDVPKRRMTRKINLSDESCKALDLEYIASPDAPPHDGSAPETVTVSR